MNKNILKRSILILPLFFAGISAQDQVDAIEAARQAKAAAEKAAADAEAATGAAIEAAAAKAAKAAREKVKQDKLDEEARKKAEKDAAEAAELDAAASAAAEAAKRKMAEELGLEYEAPTNTDVLESEEDKLAEDVETDSNSPEEFSVKEKSGFKIGLSPSVGVLSGESFTSIPVGATLVITTPYSLNVGPLLYTVSVAVGGYSGKYDSEEAGSDEVPSFVDEFNPIIAAIGGNLSLFKLVFAEGHVGLVGEGAGFRGFAGVSMENILKKKLDLPFNLLVGSELFVASDMSGVGNSSGWVSLGARLDFDF